MDEPPQETQEKPKEPKLNDINLKETVLYHHLHNIVNLLLLLDATFKR